MPESTFKEQHQLFMYSTAVKNNKEQYIAHKTEFVQKYTAIAKQLYKNRYE